MPRRYARSFGVASRPVHGWVRAPFRALMRRKRGLCVRRAGRPVRTEPSFLARRTGRRRARRAGATGFVLVTRHTGPITHPVARVTVTATPGSTPTPGVTPGPGVAFVGPKEQPRSAIPWSQVGPGVECGELVGLDGGDLGDPPPQPDRQPLRHRDDAGRRRVRHHALTAAEYSPRLPSRRRSWSGTSPGDVTHDRPRPDRRRDLHPTRRQGAPHHRHLGRHLADAATRPRRLGAK